MADPLALAYSAALILLGLVCLAVLLFDRDCKFACKPLACTPNSWDMRFLVPFGVCVAADWLQGPYVYDLYDEYGNDSKTIKALFVCGFSASMLLGPFVGTIADRCGRKVMILIGYCTLYGLACVTKHFDTLGVLYLGRIFGGAATSVLFTCFESWCASACALVGVHSSQRPASPQPQLPPPTPPHHVRPPLFWQLSCPKHPPPPSPFRPPATHPLPGSSPSTLGGSAARSSFATRSRACTLSTASPAC